MNGQTQAAAAFVGDEDFDDNECGKEVRAKLHIHLYIRMCSLT